MKRLLSITPFSLCAAVLLLLITLSCSKKTTTTYTPPGGGGTPPTPVWDPNALRGTWVTTAASSALTSLANIKDVVAKCKAGNINNIFMVVYNNGRTMYPSTVMNNLIGKPILESMAGRDPLQEMITEAHANGIKVHAWFEYGFAASYSANGGAIVTAKPHWAAKDKNNALVVKNGFDWLNAFHPEVQGFMSDLFKEVVTNYNVDGVQGDDRMPAVPSTAGYDTYTSGLYFAETGLTPPQDHLQSSWVTWRAKKLNAYLKKLRGEVKAIKPAIQFTMSPSPYPWGLTEYLQDWPTWVDSSYVDAILPQCYRYDIAAYNATIAQQKTYYKNTAVPFYPGVLVKSGTYLPTDQFLTDMIKTNRANNFKGECFFFYEGIKDKLTYFQGQYPFVK
jgi:uncharacterized lipoprotein YddW (UPF0748 family)